MKRIVREIDVDWLAKNALPCPFCANESVLLNEEPDNTWSISCSLIRSTVERPCGATIYGGLSESDSINDWNMRRKNEKNC
jgi:hypothetical protein